MTYEIKRFPIDGTIDADGHILEPANLWEDYELLQLVPFLSPLK